jgi:hypothetical protein
MMGDEVGWATYNPVSHKIVRLVGEVIEQPSPSSLRGVRNADKYHRVQ